MLRANPVTDHYDPNAWCCNHIWLHKQPLFLWQMAASMKVFGVSEFAARLPSVVTGTLVIVLLYRIALIFSGFNRRFALLAAALLACSDYHIRLISGIQGMEHNDVALSFYTMAGIWAYAEYTIKPRLRWVVLIGLFSGCAVLCKWLMGLLPFLLWGVPVMLQLIKRRSVKEIPHFLLALLCCCLVFVPWQLYILHTFPLEARYEFAFNRKHLTEVVEDHGGSVFYYLEHLPSLLGPFVFLLPFAGIALSLSDKKCNRQLLTSVLAAIAFVFCFFSFMVKTKVDTFFFLVVPLCLLFSARCLVYILQRVRSKPLVITITALVLFLSLSPVHTWNYLSGGNKERNDRIYNAGIYRNLRQYLPDSVKVVMNMNSFEDVDVMFFHNDITAYHWCLPEAELQDLARKKIPLGVFEQHGPYGIPGYVMKYPYLYIIRKRLKDL